MKNKDFASSAMNEAASAMREAMKSGNEEEIAKAWVNMQVAIKDAVKEQVDAETNDTVDTAVMTARGVRQLTSEEREYWNKVIEASKSKDYKNAIDNIDVSFPETIIEDVFREITDKHPLLSAINFQNVSILTKWILSDHTSNAAVWGDINGQITEEIEGALKEIDVQLCKLSAFAVVPMDMLELGAVYIDRYIRVLLAESISIGLEYAIVKGTGHKEPIGLVRDIHEGVVMSSTEGYPAKEKIAVTTLSPAEYGALCAQLAVSEKGNPRTISKVAFICNQYDYFTKIMPATTMLGANGYVRDLFPFPTDVYVSNALSNGEAVLAIVDEYFFGLGGSKQGTLSYSDEFKFLEDARTYKVKLHGNGRAYDNTCALYLDISNLTAAVLPVKVNNTVPVNVNNTVTTTDALYNVSLNVDPAENTTVTIVDASNVSVGACTVDEETGDVTIPALKNGAYSVTVACTGYTSQTFTFNVMGADVELADVTLVEVV